MRGQAWHNAVSYFNGYLMRKLLCCASLLLSVVLGPTLVTADGQEPCAGALAGLTEQARQLVRPMACDSQFAGVVPPQLTRELRRLPEYQARPAGLLLDLLPLARSYAIPPISNFYVGAVVEGKSGALYLGANLELMDSALGATIHAEQSALNNALLGGEQKLVRLAVTAAPCGHCRQFLNELAGAHKLEIHVVDQQPTTLADLLPQSFGPAALGEAGLGVHHKGKQCLAHKCAAAEHLAHSYAPYSNSPSAVEVQTENGIYVGRYIENAAFNPSLSPLLSALDRMRFVEPDLAAVRKITLTELQAARIRQAPSLRAMLRHIAPEAELIVNLVN